MVSVINQHFCRLQEAISPANRKDNGWSLAVTLAGRCQHWGQKQQNHPLPVDSCPCSIPPTHARPVWWTRRGKWFKQKIHRKYTEKTLTNTNTGTAPSLLHFPIQLPRTSTWTDRRTGRKTPEQGESGTANSRLSVSYGVYDLQLQELSTASSDPQFLLVLRGNAPL